MRSRLAIPPRWLAPPLFKEPRPRRATMSTKLQASVAAEVTVDVAINDYDGVVGRHVEGRVEPMYSDLTTEDAILRHLAYNAVANGVERANRLDGWADLADDAATMRVDSFEVLP
jgi:hypothetical protein